MTIEPKRSEARKENIIAARCDSRMTTQEILKELEHTTGHLPEKALRAAVEQREEITPALLEALDAAEHSITFVEENESYMLHIYSMFLLAQFQEPRAYPLMVKFFQLGQGAINATEGIVANDGDRLLACVFDGDPHPIKQVIENEDLEFSLRSHGMNALVCLVVWGRLSRESVIEYFRSLYNARFPRPGNREVWGYLVAATLNLGARELLEEVREAFRQQLIPEDMIDLAKSEKILLDEPERPMEHLRDAKPPVTDAVEEIRRWTTTGAPGVDDEEIQQQMAAQKIEKEIEKELDGPTKPTPYQATQKVGRNEPCPCGSGKKYKKCCGAKV